MKRFFHENLTYFAREFRGCSKIRETPYRAILGLNNAIYRVKRSTA